MDGVYCNRCTAITNVKMNGLDHMRGWIEIVYRKARQVSSKHISPYLYVHLPKIKRVYDSRCLACIGKTDSV